MRSRIIKRVPSRYVVPLAAVCLVVTLLASWSIVAGRILSASQKTAVATTPPPTNPTDCNDFVAAEISRTVGEPDAKTYNYMGCGHTNPSTRRVIRCGTSCRCSMFCGCWQ